MDWIAPAIMLLGSLFGGQQASSQASAANAAAQEQVALQRRIVDYLMKKREELYDPVERDVLVPQMRERATSLPFYANEWMGTARRLRRRMDLPAEGEVT